jgi:predicted kinase
MSSTPTLHFLCGKAGAGKSTIAKNLAKDHDAILICEDVWLSRLYGDQMQTFDDYLSFAQRLKTIVGPLAIDLLNSGRSVVLDFPANTKASRTWFRSVFEKASAGHLLHFVNTPNPICLQHIGKRNAERPEGSHYLSEEDFSYISSFFQPPEEEEQFNVKMHVL